MKETKRWHQKKKPNKKRKTRREKKYINMPRLLDAPVSVTNQMKPYVQYIALIFIAFFVLNLFFFLNFLVLYACCNHMEFGRFGFGWNVCFSLYRSNLVVEVEKTKKFLRRIVSFWNQTDREGERVGRKSERVRERIASTVIENSSSTADQIPKEVELDEIVSERDFCVCLVCWIRLACGKRALLENGWR